MKFPTNIKADKPTTALVVASRAKLTVFRFAQAAVQMRENALAAARAVPSDIREHGQLKQAADAQAAMQEVLKAATEAWEEWKRPIIDARRIGDEKAKAFLKDLEAEKTRLARASGDYLALLERQRQADLQQQNENLLKLEREKAAKMAKAETIEQVDQIEAEYTDRARTEAPPPQPAPKLPGQTVRQDWEVEVVDVWLLARAHPACVNITARLQDIKDLLNAGVEVKGVRAARVTKAHAVAVRTVEV